MTIEQVILNNFLISLEQDSHIFDKRLTVDEYINLKGAIASAIKALGEERPHGEWKPLGEPDDLGIHSWHICSNCGFHTTWHMVDIFHFCPNCGASMVKKEGEDK